jgi:hypothetical protein
MRDNLNAQHSGVTGLVLLVGAAFTLDTVPAVARELMFLVHRSVRHFLSVI